MKLLTIGNPKTVKGEKQGYQTAVLHLAPYKLSGYNVCPYAEIAGCWEDCLNVAGRGAISKNNETMEAAGLKIPNNVIQKARIKRTQFYMENRDEFLLQLKKEISNFIIRATSGGYIPTVRLNGTSDIKWENVKLNGKTLFEMFPEVQFYDYTKIVNRDISGISNYSLTWSYSNTNKQYSSLINAAISKGMNVAVVFRSKLPDIFHNMEVIDGDENDLRFLDKKNCIVGLKAKGKAKHNTNGFVQEGK